MALDCVNSSGSGEAHVRLQTMQSHSVTALIGLQMKAGRKSLDNISRVIEVVKEPMNFQKNSFGSMFQTLQKMELCLRLRA